VKFSTSVRQKKWYTLTGAIGLLLQVPPLVLHNCCPPIVCPELNHLHEYVNLSGGAGGAYVF
jgi:hypothetical protein